MRWAGIRTAENVEPLLDLWAETPPDDTHLVHVTRMALRDQLLVPDAYTRIAGLLANNADRAARVADVSLGVRTAESAAYLLAYVESHAVDEGRLAEYLHDAARYAAEDQFVDVTRRGQAVAAGSYARQQAVLLAIARAAQERGLPVPPATNDWAGRVATLLLTDAKPAGRATRHRARAGTAGCRRLSMRWRRWPARVTFCRCAPGGHRRLHGQRRAPRRAHAGRDRVRRGRGHATAAESGRLAGRHELARVARCVGRAIACRAGSAGPGNCAAWPAAPKGARHCWPKSRPAMLAAIVEGRHGRTEANGREVAGTGRRLGS